MRSRFSILLLIALCFATSAVAQVAASVKPESKRVLLLYGGRSEFPAIRAVDTGLREALAAHGGVEVFAEFFDFARFPAARHTGGLIALLRDRYGARKLDMVITTGYEALQFALAQRAELFPGVPITYCHVERHQLAGQTLPPDVTGAVVFHDFRRTIELALKLQPGVREAVCVFGTTELDRQVGKEALAALAKYPALQVRPMDTVPYAEIMEQVRHLSAESMVLYVNMQRDVAGQTRFPPLVAEELSAASGVPVYGFVMHQLERGLMGGAMTDYEAHGREIGALAMARLDGQTPAPRDATVSPLMINWRALKKWHVPESSVPAEAIVRFKPPSLWQEHRGMIIGIFAVVAMQSVLIAGLIVNRATRRRAERALVESITEQRHAQLQAHRLQHEIAHVSRVSMMGQLASALAHELNQPLGAILRNAEAAELFMQTEKPDLEEIRAIVADIRTDDLRASSVIDRMRTLLKRHDLDTRMLDVAELVGNVAGLARSDAATRRVKLDVEVPADLPPVRGDRVHLQQVLLNLILNGVDALNGASPEHRRVVVSARVDGAQTVEIAVSDTGHGIASEKLTQVFDPFFTTKPDGMGMGLPISRTIIEAHGGRLWAENNHGAGATFRFTLPTAEKAATA